MENRSPHSCLDLERVYHNRARRASVAQWRTNALAGAQPGMTRAAPASPDGSAASRRNAHDSSTPSAGQGPPNAATWLRLEPRRGRKPTEARPAKGSDATAPLVLGTPCAVRTPPFNPGGAAMLSTRCVWCPLAGRGRTSSAVGVARWARMESLHRSPRD